MGRRRVQTSRFHYDLNQLNGGDVVEVTLGTAANVRLLDSANFNNYRQGRQYTFYGGYVTQFPHTIRVPSNGRWNLVIDLGGYPGQIRSSVRLQRGAG
jgi:Domain of unknown function (DUF1883)